jgi:hypothetical protein
MVDATPPRVVKTPSSNHIAQFSFDASTDTLTIWFRSGDEYDFMNVPASVARSFEASDSAGQFFIRQIKGRYSYDGPK